MKKVGRLGGHGGALQLVAQVIVPAFAAMS